MSQLLTPPPPPLLIHFQFLFFRTYKTLSFRVWFFKQGQEFTIFFSGCLNLSAHLFVGNMVFVRNEMFSTLVSISSQRSVFLSLTLLIHKHTEYMAIPWECFGFAIELRGMLLYLKICLCNP